MFNRPPAPREVQYQIPTGPIPHRGASYHGLTRYETDRQQPITLDIRQAIIQNPLPFDKHIKIDSEDLKQRYLCQEVAKYLKKTEGFDGRSVEDNRVIVRGGFQRLEREAIMSQPVTPLKLFLAQGESRKA